MNDIVCRLRPCALFTLVAAVSAVAWANDLPVNLSDPDEHALRAVVAKAPNGSPMKGVLGISSYDAKEKSYVLDTATRGAVRMEAAELPTLTFEQSLQRSSQQAQTCPWETTATKGAAAKMTIRGDALRIEKGRLVLNSADLPVKVAAGETVEVQRISYDRQSDLFYVALQVYRYEIVGGPCASGGPGSTKSLQ